MEGPLNVSGWRPWNEVKGFCFNYSFISRSGRFLLEFQSWVFTLGGALTLLIAINWENLGHGFFYSQAQVFISIYSLLPVDGSFSVALIGGSFLQIFFLTTKMF